MNMRWIQNLSTLKQYFWQSKGIGKPFVKKLLKSGKKNLADEDQMDIAALSLKLGLSLCEEKREEKSSEIPP